MKSVKSKKDNILIKTAKPWDKDNIVVCSKEFVCQPSFSNRSADISDGENPCYYPPTPYRFERVINDQYAYLLDAEGNPWILSDNCFKKTSIREVIKYIYCHESEDFDFSQLNKVRGCFPLFSKEIKDRIKDRI